MEGGRGRGGGHGRSSVGEIGGGDEGANGGADFGKLNPSCALVFHF